MKESIQDRLTQRDVRQLVEIKKDLARLSVAALDIANGSGLTRREVATLMGNASPSTVQRLLAGAAYNATLDTLARFAWACGYELRAEFVPRRRKVESEPPASDRDQRCEVYQLEYYQRLANGTGGWPAPAANGNNFFPEAKAGNG